MLNLDTWTNNHSRRGVIWDKVFKDGPSKRCGRQPLKKWKGYGLLSRPYCVKFFKGCLPQLLLGPFLNTLSHLFTSLRNSGFKRLVLLCT